MTPSTSQRLVAHTFGEPADVLRLDAHAVPDPGPGQVRIQVLAAPVHPADLHVLRGRSGDAPELPAVLGIECVGRVDAVGDGVAHLAVGQRVITVRVTGTWQQHVVADAAQVVPIPGAVSDSTAAQIVINPLTALLLVTELDIQPGEWLLQTAAGSTLGRLVLQLARHFGLQTINVVRRRAAVREILDLGGSAVICTEDEDVIDRVAEITGGEGVHWAIDSVGGEVGADVARTLSGGGEMIVFGALSNQLVIPLRAASLIHGATTVRGFWLDHWFATTPRERVEAALGQTLSLVIDGPIRIPAGQPLPLAEFADAVRLAEAPGHDGKPLLMP